MDRKNLTVLIITGLLASSCSQAGDMANLVIPVGSAGGSSPMGSENSGSFGSGGTLIPFPSSSSASSGSNPGTCLCATTPQADAGKGQIIYSGPYHTNVEGQPVPDVWSSELQQTDLGGGTTLYCLTKDAGAGDSGQSGSSGSGGSDNSAGGSDSGGSAGKAGCDAGTGTGGKENNAGAGGSAGSGGCSCGSAGAGGAEKPDAGPPPDAGINWEIPHFRPCLCPINPADAGADSSWKAPPIY